MSLGDRTYKGIGFSGEGLNIWTKSLWCPANKDKSDLGCLSLWQPCMLRNSDGDAPFQCCLSQLSSFFSILQRLIIQLKVQECCCSVIMASVEISMGQVLPIKLLKQLVKSQYSFYVLAGFQVCNSFTVQTRKALTLIAILCC